PSVPFLLLNPSAGWPHKSWRAGRWAELIRGLFGSQPPKILITSGPQDWQRRQAAEAFEALGPNVARTAGNTSLPGFLWLCSRAAAVLTVDGAAAHLAAAFGVPALTLFGPTNPAHWHRPGPLACAVRTAPGPDGSHRMKYLAVEDILPAARLWLNGSGALDRLRAAG
ncbi:MAG: hypothetical protein N2322_08005, partial [Terrimicrobiaceae bacterium]|nr:hypothetical protein [Terrimicrobiaceae bacterium]